MAHLDGAVADRVGAPGTCRRSRPPRRAGSGTCRRSTSVTYLAMALGGAIDGVERLRKARAQAPLDLRHRLRDRRASQPPWPQGRRRPPAGIDDVSFRFSSPLCGASLWARVAGLGDKTRNFAVYARVIFIKVVLTFRRHRGPRALAAAWTAGPPRAKLRRRAPMKRSIFAVSLLACLSSATAEEARTIRIATEGAFPPFNYIEGNEPQGFEVELGRALCEAAKASVHLRDPRVGRHDQGPASRRVRRGHGLARHHREAPSPYRLLEALLPHSGGLRGAQGERDRRRRAGSARRQGHRHDRRQPARRASSRSVIPRRR